MMALTRRILLYLHTIKYLRYSQIYYQIFYRLRAYFFRRPLSIKIKKAPVGHSLLLDHSIHSANSYHNYHFEFLNKGKTFHSRIDWDFRQHGKLWAYNLNYFDFLNQKDIDASEGIALIEDFSRDIEHHKEAAEPYTISLRGINWIKFFSYHKIANPHLNKKLYIQFKQLTSSLEYHLLGNHLLENGFSLLFGAYYFQEEYFYKKARRILRAELEEQILMDGGHFELSPMYHQIILFRLLDAINLVKNNAWHEHQLLPFLERKAGAMLGWLRAITFRNGHVPMVNDSAHGIAPTSVELFNYAARLSVLPNQVALMDSGYEMIRGEDFELLVDIGDIGPDYIPGHAHSDTFNFVLYVKGHPVIVDTGTSTYEGSSRRQTERSTVSHNTVIVDNKEQSDVWGSFRVARRARVVRRTVKEGEISASHDGYKKMGILHTRAWRWGHKSIQVTDHINSNEAVNASALLHFHPSVAVTMKSSIVTAGPLTIHFKAEHKVELNEYEYACGFNKTTTSTLLKIAFNTDLVTTMTWAD